MDIDTIEAKRRVAIKLKAALDALDDLDLSQDDVDRHYRQFGQRLDEQLAEELASAKEPDR